MNFLIRKSFFVVAGVILGLVSFVVINKDSLPERTIEISGPTIDLKNIAVSEYLNLSEKIKEGTELLENSPVLGIEEYVTENVCFITGKTYRGLRKEISFAILDKDTGVVFEKRCWFSKEDIKEAEIFGGSLEKISDFLGLGNKKNEGDIINEELNLVINWWNGHNSDIAIKSLNPKDKEGRYIIVANKYPMLNDYLAYPQDRTGKKYSDIIYVPYSGALHTQELIDEGRNFLNESVDTAYRELGEEGVQSVAYPGKLVIDTVSPVFVKNIFLTEQTDPSLIFLAQDGGRKLAERVLVRLGTNKEKAFRYTYSSVGALGLGQIMPATYSNIRNFYPRAELIKDKNIGRVDIINGIKATILVFDDHFATVLKKLGDNKSGASSLSKKLPAEIEEMRAAIYNGGPGKINAQTAAISSAIEETVSFVAKFKMIRSLGLFN